MSHKIAILLLVITLFVISSGGDKGGYKIDKDCPPHSEYVEMGNNCMDACNKELVRCSEQKSRCFCLEENFRRGDPQKKNQPYCIPKQKCNNEKIENPKNQNKNNKNRNKKNKNKNKKNKNKKNKNKKNEEKKN